MKVDVAHPPVIESGVQPIWVRVRDIFLTLVMWAIYLYLMDDFFSFVHTLFEWEVNGVARADLPQAFRILHTMEIYLFVIVVNSALLIGWALYNLLRFRGKDRRRKRRPIESEDLSDFYGVATKDVKKWQRTRILIMHHDEHGHLLEVEQNRGN